MVGVAIQFLAEACLVRQGAVVDVPVREPRGRDDLRNHAIDVLVAARQRRDLRRKRPAAQRVAERVDLQRFVPAQRDAEKRLGRARARHLQVQRF